MNKNLASVSEAVLLSVDVEQIVSRQKWQWSVVCQRPGRAGVFRKTWTSHSGQLDSDQAKDLSAWVSGTVHAALVAWGSVRPEPEA